MTDRQKQARNGPFSSLNKQQQTLIMLDFEGNLSNKEIAPKIGLKNPTTVSHWRKRSWYEPAFNEYAAKAVKGRYKSLALRKLIGLLDAKSEMVQLQSATTILRLSGMLSENSTPELDKARIRKANADARVAEARAKSLEENGQDVAQALDMIMDKLTSESDKVASKEE